MLEKGSDAIVRFQPASYTLTPANVNIYARRHSAHSYPTTEQIATVRVSTSKKKYFLSKYQNNIKLMNLITNCKILKLCMLFSQK